MYSNGRDKLYEYVFNRPKNVPLITIENHTSVYDTLLLMLTVGASMI